MAVRESAANTGSLQPDFGKASAAKRGRNPKWPYVPIIKYPNVYGQQTEQIKKRAYATRDEAVACAQRVIDNRTDLYETNLIRNPALRQQRGFPRSLIGVKVTTREPGPVGIVVEATQEERTAGAVEFGPAFRSLDGYSLVEWPDGRRWQRPEEIRIVRPDLDTS